MIWASSNCQRCRKRTSRFLSGQPGFASYVEGSTKQMNRSALSTLLKKPFSYASSFSTAQVYPNSSRGVTGVLGLSSGSPPPRMRLARKKPLWRTSDLYLHVCTASTKYVVSLACSLLGSPICFQGGSDCMAGKPKWYVNLYFFKLAKMMAVKDESREGHSYIEPSCMASHI